MLGGSAIVVQVLIGRESQMKLVSVHGRQSMASVRFEKRFASYSRRTKSFRIARKGVVQPAELRPLRP
jgi:hypothetical protein